MAKSKQVKLQNVIVAYDRFDKKPSIAVQLIDFQLHRPIAEFQLPKETFTRSFEELQTVIRFRARRDFDLILPKTWVFWNYYAK